jgi:Uma2 family endonuclease
MSQSSVAAEFSLPIKINIQGIRLTEDQFMLLCQENPDLQFELTARQELVIMPPTGFETGRRNSRLTRYLDLWSEADSTGISCDSSTLFALPNGAKRSPDAAWIRRALVEQLSQEQREGVLPLCPEFVVELRSSTDRLADLQEKMHEYITNGARLGWLIDPFDKRVYVYRSDQSPEILDDPAELRGDPVLPGFVLPVRELW